MYHNSIGIAIICLTSISLSSCTDSGSGTQKVSLEGHSTGSHYQSGITSDAKAELAKNRRKQIRLIRKGDFFMAKNNPEEALVAYLEVLEKLPDDLVVEKKIANAYFEKKDWNNAYLYFTRVPIGELKQDEKKKMFHALFFETSQIDRLKEIEKFSLSNEDKEYYQMINVCLGGIDPCIQSLSSYTGSQKELYSLRNTIKNAPKISPDLAYRNFSLATEFYVLGEYSVSYALAQNILKERGDYFDVQKLVGFSLFALGHYSDSRDILRTYLEHVPGDIEVIVRLGEVSALLKNYIDANLYLNNAVTAGYKNKINIERALAYNYSQLGDASAMIKVLSYLLSEEGVLEDDFAVAISLAFARGENTRAYVWAMEGLKKFPNSSVIAPMYMMSLRIMGRGADVPTFASTLTGEILSSPLVLLELGIYAFDSGDFPSAKEKFKSVYTIDADADFGIEAENYLKQIEEKEVLMKQEEEPQSTEVEKKGWWF